MGAHAPGFLALVNDAKSRIKELTIADVKAMLAKRESFRLIDTREDHEWEAGHIQGAEHLGKGVIERDIEAAIPNKQEKLVLYCGGGFRSALSADNLQKMGYTNVYSMDGGFRGWKDSGGPIALPK